MERDRVRADTFSPLSNPSDASARAPLQTDDPWPPSGYSSSVWAATDGTGAWYWDGDDWSQRSGGDLGTSAVVADIAVSPYDHDRVLAATADGLYVTTTSQSWVSLTLPFTNAQWKGLRWDTHTPGVVFAVGKRPTDDALNPTIPIWARSTDNGETWVGGDLYEGSTFYWRYRIAGAIDVWGAGQHWYIGSENGHSGQYTKRYWRSTDGGATWSADLVDADEWFVNQQKWVAGRPDQPTTVFMAPYGQSGSNTEPVVRSFDGGDNWTEVGEVEYPRHIEYDRTRTNTLWAAMEDGVALSVNDGVTFTDVHPGYQDFYALSIDGYTGRVYAGDDDGDGTMAYTDDGGDSWTEDAIGEDKDILSLAAPQPPYLPDEMTWNKAECPFCAPQAINWLGDPVNTRTGGFTHNQPGFALPVLGGALEFRLTYISRATGDYTTTLGYGWTHNHATGLTFPFDVTGPVVLQGHGGSLMTFGNNGDGTFSAAPGVRADLTRLGDSSPYTYVITATTQQVYTFDDDGLLLSIEDPQGNVTHYEYDGSQRLDRVIGPSSDAGQKHVLAFSYDGSNRLTSVSGLLSGTTSLSYSVGMGYDGSGNLTVFTDTRGLEWTYAYSTSHLLRKVTDPNGNDVVENVYDSDERVTEQKDPLGRSLYLQYTLSGTTIITDALGRVTVDGYDGRGTWVGTAYTDSQVITRSYDADLNLGLTADPLGNETGYEWSEGEYDLETVTDALGEETSFDYDSSHNLTQVVNALGYTTTYEYDADNNLITVTDALDGVTTNTYDGYDNLSSTTDPDGNTTSYEANAFGQRTAITDALGFVTRFQYDVLGRLITTTRRADDGALLDVTVNAYDLADNVLQVTDNYTTASSSQNYLDLWNLVTAYGYDGVGNRTAMTDTLGRVSMTAFDAADRVISTTRNYTSAGGIDYDAAYNRVTRYGYDAVGNQSVLTTTAPPQGDVAAGQVVTGARVTRTTYDDFDRPAKTVVNHQDGVYEADRPDEDIVTTYAYDAAGNLITTTDTLGRRTVNAYDDANRLVETTVNYTSTSGVDANTYNLSTEYDYDAVGNVITTTDPLGRVTVNAYDALNRLVETTVNYTTTSSSQNYLNQYNLVTAYGYDGVGNRTAITDTLGQVTHFEYDDVGRLLTTTVNYTSTVGADANTYNLQTVYRYDDGGNRDRVTDPASQATDYDYDVLDRLIQVEDAEGTVTGYAYDVADNRIAITRAVGTAVEQETRYTFDAMDRPVTTTDALNGATVVAYDPFGNAVEQTDARGNAVGVEVDRLNRPLRRISLEGLDGQVLAQDGFADASNWSVAAGTWSIDSGTYRQTNQDPDDRDGMISLYSSLTVTDFVAFVDVKFEAITESYALAGLVFRRSADGDEATDAGVRVANDEAWPSMIGSNPDGGWGGPYSSTFRVMAAGPLNVEMGAWHRVGVVARGSEVILLLDGMPVTSWDKDPQSSGAIGLITFYADVRFDNFLVRKLDGYRETRYTYDGLGNTIAVRDPLSHTTVYTYDGLNRLVAVEDAEGNLTQYVCDKPGNRTVMTDAEGVETRYTYDALGRLTAVVENYSGGSQTSEQDVRTAYAYDALGNRTQVTDGLAHTTVYSYDPLGRLVSEEDPLGHLTGYAYDQRESLWGDQLGNRTAMTQAVGTSDETATTYGYDEVSRLTGVTYPDATVAYVYDAAGNRTTMTDSLGTTTYTYDALYRLQAVKDPYDAWVGFGYDAVGNRDDLVYPDPSAGSGQGDDTVTHTFDVLNRLTQVEDWDGGTAAYGYDLSGRMVTATLPNGTETAYSYDDANRLTLIEHRESGGDLLARYVYELDGVGNRVQATETISTPGSGLITTTITYTYDSLYRLTEADYSSGENFQYVYDAVGNRTSYTATITSTQNITYSYDAANRLVNVGGVAYTWDDLGRLVNDGTYTYTWDSASRLITVTDGISTYGFRYDGDGNRLTGISNGTFTTYALDVGLALPEVLVEQGSGGTTRYVHLPNAIATDDGAAWSYSAADGLGSIRQQLDASGQVDAVNCYRPFGLPLEGNGGDPYGYTGEWWTTYANRGMLFLRARYYAPQAGRFLSPDTIVPDYAFPPSVHRYSYVYNNAVSFTDPSGLCPPNDPRCTPSPQPRPGSPIGTPIPGTPHPPTPTPIPTPVSIPTPPSAPPIVPVGTFEPYTPEPHYYNRQAAVSFAIRYSCGSHFALGTYNNFLGSECTIFVSEALAAGGLPMTRGWYVQPETFRLPIKTGCGLDPWNLDCTNSWSSAPDLYNYLTKDLGFRSYSLDTVMQSLEERDPPHIPVEFPVEPGDVVFYQAAEESNFGHTALVIGWGPRTFFQNRNKPQQCSTRLPLPLALFYRGEADWLPWIVDRQGAGYKRAFDDTSRTNRVVLVHIPLFLGEW